MQRALSKMPRNKSPNHPRRILTKLQPATAIKWITKELHNQALKPNELTNHDTMSNVNPLHAHINT